MFDYARSDTHFLLYIFDCMRNEILDRPNSEDSGESKMQYVLQNSKEVALKRYEREDYDAENGQGSLGWYNMLWRGDLNDVQEAVFKAIHQWRDQVAREEDEGLHYVISRHQLFSLVRQLPTDVNTVLSLCTPASHIVRARAAEIVAIIRHVKENPPAAAHRKAAHSPPLSITKPVTATEGISARNSEKYRLANAFRKEPTVPEIHASGSSFWGGAFGSSKWEIINNNAGSEKPNKDVRLAIPLPQLTAAVFVTAEDELSSPRTTPQKSADPGARAEHEYVKGASQRRKERDIIVVKSLGGARKRKLGDVIAEDEDQHSNATPTSQSEMEYVEESMQGSANMDTGEGLARKRSKSEKKEVKRRAREQAAADEEEADGEMEIEDDKTFEAFDYTKAAPVFNGHKGNAGGKEGKAQKQRLKVFDPYSKSQDAPRGMNRGQRERAGKSHTFKQ